MAISAPEARLEAGWPDLPSWLDFLIEIDVDTVQIREKTWDGNATVLPDALHLYEATVQAVDHVADRLTVIVNGRADIAHAAGAHGVHLTSSSLPVDTIKTHFPELRVGRSTHTPAEILAAREQGADYVTFSPIFATPSKAAHGDPQGISRLREAVELDLPVLGLGGIEPGNVAEICRLAAGCAAIRTFHDPREARVMVKNARQTETVPQGDS